MAKVAILGLGLIGGSIGLALKKANAEGKLHKGWEVLGHDKDPETSARARKRGAVDRSEWSLVDAVEDADLVVIATPVRTVKTVFEQIAPHLKAGAVVTDTASTKVNVLEWARDLLPDTVSFVGGHPMAGKEIPGIESAEADLFEGAVWCICPGVNASEGSVQQVIALAEAVGATHYSVDPHEHDGLVAGVSHLPIVAAAALVGATSSSPSWREMKKLASSGYRDTTRLASGEPTMNLDICLTNQAQVISWIDRYIEELQHFRALVAEGGESLNQAFVETQKARDLWAYGDKEPEGQMASIRESMSMGAMLFGERLSRTVRGFGSGDRKR